MGITRAGYVGIGNTTPPETLSVSGNISGSGHLLLDGSKGISIGA
jgi:hypothetical protein